MTSAAEETLTYVYAVVRRAQAPHDALAGVTGVLGAPVRLLYEPAASGARGEPLPGGHGPAEGVLDEALVDDTDETEETEETDEAGASGRPGAVVFVVSPVPRRDFDEAALKDHFEDLEWLESVARAHHDVVQALAAHATVLPLRMATVYQDDARAGQALARRREAFAERLAGLEAHTEFGVKMYLLRSGTPRPGAEPAAEAPAQSPGKAYLRRRKAQHHAQEAAYDEARRAAETIEAAASPHASQRVRHAVQRGALTGPEENVLNDAYLVPDARAEAFRAAVTRAARDFPDVRVDVTGPWAPYSFVTPPDEADEAVGTPDETGHPPQEAHQAEGPSPSREPGYPPGAPHAPLGAPDRPGSPPGVRHEAPGPSAEPGHPPGVRHDPPDTRRSAS
ncbi:GvpL/GvpF family gas vesicle protein [Streptomyces sp. NPDC053755]|uniref:GvpL/GvpF family gas vesicle protein n=1 Tax=Streptomyces sp. NPDC053755 TaxID=3155815 RepID=UPI003428C8CE